MLLVNDILECYTTLPLSGMQSGVLVEAAPYALPLRFKLLPEYLNRLSYESHAVGK